MVLRGLRVRGDRASGHRNYFWGLGFPVTMVRSVAQTIGHAEAAGEQAVAQPHQHLPLPRYWASWTLQWCALLGRGPLKAETRVRLP